MKRMLSILLMLMLVPCAALAEEEDEPVTPMHELTMAHGFRFGGALSYMQLWDANYLNFLKTHCNSITATNEMKAYSLLEQLRSGSTDQAVRDQFNSMKKDLGYGLLLKRYTPNVADATEAQIQQATKDSIPRVAPLYFAFRIMVACGFLLLAIIALSFWSVIRNRIGEKKWLLRAALYGIPLPWIAVEAGWFVAEYGRQPWAIGEVLPTAVANSSLTAGDLIFSMVLICGLYTLFLVAELFLMFKFARLGPSSLKTGRYHFEQSSTTTQPAR